MKNKVKKLVGESVELENIKIELDQVCGVSHATVTVVDLGVTAIYRYQNKKLVLVEGLAHVMVIDSMKELFIKWIT